MYKGYVLLAFSLLAFLASWYCFLWVLSSSSLAFVDCNGTYTLFHEHLRCRWPAIAALLWQATGMCALLLLGIGIYVLRKNSRKNIDGR